MVILLVKQLVCKPEAGFRALHVLFYEAGELLLERFKRALAPYKAGIANQEGYGYNVCALGIYLMRGMQNGNLYNVLAAAVGMHGRIHEYDRFIVRRKAIGDKEVITCRPADLLEPELEKYEKEVKELGYYEQEEDVLSYALFPKVAPKFFEARKEAKEGKSAAPAAKAAPMDPNKVYSLYVEDKEL